MGMFKKPVAQQEIPPLKDQILALLSLASVEGQSNLPFTGCFEIFSDLRDEFGPMFPGLIFIKTPFSTYSKQLDGALQGLLARSVPFPNPKLKYLQVPPEAATRHLAWLREKYGEEYIGSLQPVVNRLVQRLRAH